MEPRRAAAPFLLQWAEPLGASCRKRVEEKKEEKKKEKRKTEVRVRRKVSSGAGV